MNLFNASTLLSENIDKMIGLMDDPGAVKDLLNEMKGLLLGAYQFRAYNIPEDFTSSSYIIATNHLTDADAPLIISFNHQMMSPIENAETELFVFAKENCFNGVSIPQALVPILEKEKVFPVDRASLNGSMAAMRAAKQWYGEGPKPKHFLIFPQGTIYDINRDTIEDIERGAFWLSRMLSIPVLPAFIEQAVENEQNRLVFAEPIQVPADTRDFTDLKALWLERVIAAQNALESLTGIPARQTVLDEAHQVRKKFKA